MRTRQGPGGTLAVRHDGALPPRAPMTAALEASAGRDEQVGQIFRNMRVAMNVSRETIARRLATSSTTVDNFEAGAIAALPHWKETARIIRSYCELLRLDPEPILWRIRSQLQAVADQAGAAAPIPAPLPPASAAFPAVSPPPPSILTDPPRAAPKRQRLGLQALVALAVPVVLVAVLVGFAHLAPRPAYRAIMLLPDPIEASLRAGLDYLTLMSAPRREGLRWIDVGDPQLRKADKLPTSRP